MNCKPGDLAIVVARGSIAQTPEILGRIVTVVRHAVDGEFLVSVDGRKIQAINGVHPICWVIEATVPLPWAAANGVRLGSFRQRMISDLYLMPIRDQPGADESLSWASLPTTPTKEVA